jgi:hypothetical protein
MKLEFTLIIDGDSAIGKKLEDSVKNLPHLRSHLMTTIFQAIMVSLRLSEKDEVSIDTFRVKILDESKPEPESNQPTFWDWFSKKKNN